MSEDAKQLMIDTEAVIPDAIKAYYEKEQVRTLKVQLDSFRTCLATCSNPKKRAWLERHISSLRLVMFERFGIWY